MDYKKVGSVRLSYTLGDGTLIERDYTAEFNKGEFSGNITAASGTFAGTLTAHAIDAVNNVNIQGNAAARTWIAQVPYVSHWDDDGIWRPVISLDVDIPYSDQDGGWLAIVVQYRLFDNKDDNRHFRCRHRFVVGGQVAYTSEEGRLEGFAYGKNSHEYLHEFLYPVLGPGTWRIALEWVVYPASTNMYIAFDRCFIRADYIRK